jgi:hypothetical protein
MGSGDPEVAQCLVMALDDDNLHTALDEFESAGHAQVSSLWQAWDDLTGGGKPGKQDAK